jgi:hypothetical protein
LTPESEDDMKSEPPPMPETTFLLGLVLVFVALAVTVIESFFIE